MKLVIDLPDWCEGRHIYILAGIELVAFHQHGEDWWRVKTERCKQCGDCCSKPDAPDYSEKLGSCEYLEHLGDEHRCRLAVLRPTGCTIGDPMTATHRDWSKCSIKFDERPIKE